LIEENNNNIFTNERKTINRLIKDSIKTNKPESLYSPAKYILDSDGKCIRGILVLLGYKIVNKGKFNKKIYFAAVALELLHLFTLIHDDIMDNAKTRRGRQTLHERWDTNTAILCGDFLVGLAFEFLLKADFLNIGFAVKEFNGALIKVCEGQAYDKEFELRKTITLNEYENMIQLKTGRLIESSVIIGAMLAGAGKKEIEKLRKYGKLLGKAFQIQDDLLDLVGDENKLGKNKFGDIKESKKTYFFASALNFLCKEKKESFLKIFDKKNKNNSDIQKILNFFYLCNLISKAQEEINQIIFLAKKFLLIFNEEKRKPLEILADKLRIRTY
jgi:geranylgeranyl diphosphate synthase type II